MNHWAEREREREKEARDGDRKRQRARHRLTFTQSPSCSCTHTPPPFPPSSFPSMTKSQSFLRSLFYPLPFFFFFFLSLLLLLLFFSLSRFSLVSRLSSPLPPIPFYTLFPSLPSV